MEARCAMLLHSVGALAENAAINFRFHLAGFSSLVAATSKDTPGYRRGVSLWSGYVDRCWENRLRSEGCLEVSTYF